MPLTVMLRGWVVERLREEQRRHGGDGEGSGHE